MNQFISKVKNLSQKAAEIKAAMQQVPPKVAEIREAVASTAGQLQQLRVDVQSTIGNLKADNEQHISQAMQEINSSLDVFLEAGFELGGMDLEISPVQRLLVHLNRLDEVHPSVLRSLIPANQHRRTTQALLTSMLQAQEMADTVQLGELTKCDYRELIVSIGPIPSVRICWRPVEAVEAEQVAQPAKAIPVSAPAAQTTQPAAPQSAFAQSSYFEKRASQSLPLPASLTAATPPVATFAPHPEPIRVPLPVAKSPAAETTSTTTDPLARFKKMPDLSKFKK